MEGWGEGGRIKIKTGQIKRPPLPPPLPPSATLLRESGSHQRFNTAGAVGRGVIPLLVYFFCLAELRFLRRMKLVDKLVAN